MSHVTFKRFPSLAAATEAAEAVGRLYAASIARPYPMPPDVYGPGRQPVPREAYYQRWWVAPQAAIPADPGNGVPHALPHRIEPDGFTVAQHGLTVAIANGGNVTLNFQGLEV